MRTVITRKIDHLGRIVLPKELRDREGLETGIEVDILVNDIGDIIIRRSMTHCIYCGTNKSIFTFKNKAVCMVCKNELMQKTLNNCEANI